MQFLSESLAGGILERLFKLEVNGESVPGVLWTPAGSPKNLPLLPMGHGGGQHKKFVGVANRAQRYVKDFGFAVAAIDAPGHGERVRSEQDAAFVTALQQKMAEGQPVEDLVAREMSRLAERAVPEWQATLDAVQSLDEIGAAGPVGYWGLSMGGAIGVYLVAVEPRISAAVLGLVGLPPNFEALSAAAAGITVPVEFVLQWDDELVPRPSGIALFNALGSQEKTLHANPGVHMAVPRWETESWERFFKRNLVKSL